MVEPPPTAWASGSHLELAFWVSEPYLVCQSQQGGGSQGPVEGAVEGGELSGQPAHRLPRAPHNQGGLLHILRTLVPHTPHTPHKQAPHTLHIRHTLVLRIQAVLVLHNLEAQAPHIQASHPGELPQSKLPLQQLSRQAAPGRCSRRCSPGTLRPPKRTLGGSSRTLCNILQSWDIPPCGQSQIHLP